MAKNDSGRVMGGLIFEEQKVHFTCMCVVNYALKMSVTVVYTEIYAQANFFILHEFVLGARFFRVQFLQDELML